MFLIIHLTDHLIFRRCLRRAPSKQNQMCHKPLKKMNCHTNINDIAPQLIRTSVNNFQTITVLCTDSSKPGDNAPSHLPCPFVQSLLELTRPFHILSAIDKVSGLSGCLRPTVILTKLLLMKNNGICIWKQLKRLKFCRNVAQYNDLIYKCLYDGSRFYGCKNRFDVVVFRHNGSQKVGLLQVALLLNHPDTSSYDRLSFTTLLHDVQREDGNKAVVYIYGYI